MLTSNRIVSLLMLGLVSGSVYASEIQSEALNKWFEIINRSLKAVIFFDILPCDPEMPFIVAWLIIAGIFLTFRMGFVNLRMMPHSLAIISGRYRTAEDQGDVSSFQALTAAISATVGLGNIAGVAIAISLGGPGATLWMILAGFVGMTTKFTEATLAQMYREFRTDGRVMGGAMEYLSKGFAELGMK
ncbi:alanine glycine permease, partial [Achromatium sp. WMS2]